jgi:hypothetical protein
MFGKSLFIQPTSAFVPFSGGASGELELARVATQDQPATDWAAHAVRRTTWEAPAGPGVRRVEMVILASVCGYFTFGLGGLLGLY